MAFKSKQVNGGTAQDRAGRFVWTDGEFMIHRETPEDRECVTEKQESLKELLKRKPKVKPEPRWKRFVDTDADFTIIDADGKKYTPGEFAKRERHEG